MEGFINQFGINPNYQQSMANQPRITSWLGSDQYESMRKDLNRFNLNVTKDELTKSGCNHYTPNGQVALVANGDGTYTCTGCGETIHLSQPPRDVVQDNVNNIIDILESIKAMYISLDPNAALTYFQIIPFIKKIPQLYENACADFSKYENVNSALYPNNTGMNAFAAFSAILNPAYQQPMYGQQPNMGAYQTPMYNQQMYQQPMYGQQQPAQAPMYQQPVYGGQSQVPNQAFNPLYQQPMTPTQQQPAGYQPQTQGFAMNPQGAAAPQQPAQPVQVNTNMPVQPVNQAATPKDTGVMPR